MSVLPAGQSDLAAKFSAAAPYLPRPTQVITTNVFNAYIGPQELAMVCRAMGDDFANALTNGIQPVTFLGHLKSVVFVLHATAVFAEGQSSSWHVLSSGLSRLTMSATPHHFYAIANELSREQT